MVVLVAGLGVVVGRAAVDKVLPFTGRTTLPTDAAEVAFDDAAELDTTPGLAMEAEGGRCRGGLTGLESPAPIGLGTLLPSGGRLTAGRPTCIGRAATPVVPVADADDGRAVPSVFGCAVGLPALLPVIEGLPSAGRAAMVPEGCDGRPTLFAKGGLPAGLPTGLAVAPSEGPGDGDDWAGSSPAAILL